MWASIFDDIGRKFGLTVTEAVSVSGGYLNQKRKITTERGSYLVKQFSEARYARPLHTRLEDALRRAMIVHDAGVPSPQILVSGDRIIQYTDRDTAYMVMSFCEGECRTSKTISVSEMHALGAACGKMHCVLAALPCVGVHRYPLSGTDVCNALFTHIEKLKSLPAYDTLMPHLEKRMEELSPKALETLPRQICHEDFAADNLLFANGTLSAVLDFDRGQYGFPLHDVGRALMSFAFDETALRPVYLRAFRDGYAIFRALSAKELLWALRLVFVLEVPWWLGAGYETAESPKVRRFAREIHYLTKYGGDLSALVNEAFV